MINIDQALKHILNSAKIMEPEFLKLSDALGRILAEDVYSKFDIPVWDNSAMDGYALRAKDTIGISKDKPEVFEVIELVRAGSLPSKVVGEKQAIKIMTGASMPKGADSVIKVEDTQAESGTKVSIFNRTDSGINVRKSGEGIKSGELVITKGTYLNSAALGVLASLGKPKLKVIKQPRVAILATGDEVVEVDEPFTQGKLYSANTYSLCSQVREAGGIPKNLGIASDEPEHLRKKIEEGLDCNLIITSGGVSMGDYDLVKSVLEEMGAEIKFWKVAIRPGKPVLFGLLKGIPVFGLPGNPVSSMISFEVFARSAILKMLGQKDNNRKEVEAFLEEDIKKKRGLQYLLRAQTRWEDGAYRTHTTGPQGSGILKSMLLANSLIVLPEDEEHLEKGKKVTVRFID